MSETTTRRNYGPERDYIEGVYQVLSPEELFSRAKEHSWQTFFHHSASVAIISYRLAQLYKEQERWSVAQLAVRGIEQRYGVKFEELAFLLGLAHDYVKLYGIQGETGKERMREILGKLLEEYSLATAIDTIVETVVAAARAVEGVDVPRVTSDLLTYVAPLVRVADKLMGVDSVDDAVRELLASRWELGDIRFGYVKLSLPSILQAKVSEEIVGVLRKHGWVPLALYYDGLVLVGGENAEAVPIREVVEVLEKEVARAFDVKEKVEQIASALSKKQIASIYSKLAQTQGKVLLEGDDPTVIYHNIIVRYLGGTPLRELAGYLSQARAKRKRLLDPRSLATGLEGGSKYFAEYLGTMMVTKDALTNAVLSLKSDGEDSKKLFLVLTYVTAFASSDEGKVVNILRRAFGVDLPRDVDKDLLYAVAMAEVYKRLGSDDTVRRVVEVVYDELGGVLDVQYYVTKFVLTSIKSNIIDAESASSVDALVKAPREGYVSYCRVCGAPLLSESIAFIEYARAVGARGGSASEMWLHDDLPLASLEAISTDKKSRIRFICPVCYYEAKKLGEEFSPPFLVFALHPVVAYDVWLWLVERLSVVKLASPSVLKEAERWELAKEYSERMRSGYKVPADSRQVASGSYTVCVDFLGARMIIPLRVDMSLKKRDVAAAILLAPLAMSLAGGGQVALANNLAYVYNLGTGQLPVVLPHHVPLLYDTWKAFESVKAKAGIERRRMTLDEYSVYNKSYLTMLEALYVYGLKVLAWYSMWGRKGLQQVEFGEYALKLLEHMSSIPYTPLALSAPPPPSLDPRAGDESLPYYNLISQKSREVESRMSQAQGMSEGVEPASITKALYRYARRLSELSGDLSKHAVQKPLRTAIEVITEYAPIIGSEEARKLAREKFIEVIETSLGVDLGSIEKRIRDKKGGERQVTYRQLLRRAFDDISKALTDAMQKLPPSKLSRLVEVLLDVAYENYKECLGKRKQVTQNTK